MVPPGAVVAIGVLDRDAVGANTDNLAVVDPTKETITWVPRDLWSPVVGDRINRAWAVGGVDLLRRALAEAGHDVDDAIVLARRTVADYLDSIEAVVPVDRPMAFLYPRAPDEPIEAGATLVRFEPPDERLAGTRLHQWVGARLTPSGDGSDLDRIRRQQVLLRVLLDTGADLGRVLLGTGDVAPRSRAALAEVGPHWRFDVHDDLVPARIGGKEVLVARTPRTVTGHAARRAISRAGRVAGARLRIPSGGRRRPLRATRLVAVLAVRDEQRYLPGWLRNVAPHVDGVVALDDGSIDDSVEILASHPLVLEVIRRPRELSEVWDEVGNHRLLVAAAIAHGATWIVALDADERVERDFRDRVERVVSRGERVGLTAFALPLRELWDDPTTWRADGIWGRKRVPRLFAARPDHAFDVRPLHAAKAPLQGKRFGGFVTADVGLYHLRMIERGDRVARRERYEALDPDGVWQPTGYAYLTDETSLRLRRVSARRAPTLDGRTGR
jgi:hypothetical protein